MSLYDPLKVSVIINGVPIKGFAKGTFVEFSYNEPRTSTEVGAQGDPNTALSRDRSGKLKFTLMNNQPSNQYMEYMTQLHDQGLGYSATFVGPNGGYTCAESFTGEVAPLGYSEKADDSREWEVDMPVANPSPDPLVAAVVQALT